MPDRVRNPSIVMKGGLPDHQELLLTLYLAGTGPGKQLDSDADNVIEFNHTC